MLGLSDDLILELTLETKEVVGYGKTHQSFDKLRKFIVERDKCDTNTMAQNFMHFVRALPVIVKNEIEKM